MKLLFLMGLTGVGKSTAVTTVLNDTRQYTLLPNRRALTDLLIIPETQRAAGRPVQTVTDRVTRFELTRRYREVHPGGMVHALSCFLRTQPQGGADTLVFDNLRGQEEAEAAPTTFPGARFIVLDAPPMVRLQRLLGRRDAFDQVFDHVFDRVAGQGAGQSAVATRLENTAFTDKLLALDGLERVFDLYELARLEASGVDETELLGAVRIILSEAQNYDMDAAKASLRRALNDAQLLVLETETLSAPEVAARVGGWL